MQFTIILSGLFLTATSSVSAAATPAPGFHNVGDPCTEAQIDVTGCSSDGSQLVTCESNLLQLKGLKGQSWEGGASCTDKAENFFGVCMCDSNGNDCKCVAPATSE